MLVAEQNTNPWDNLAQLFKALGHPVRLRIVSGLASGSCNVGHIWHCLDLPQPTVSQHLKILRQEGVLVAERQGKEMVYRLADPRISRLLGALGGPLPGAFPARAGDA